MENYHVIGIMSGTSLDGVDLAYCRFTYNEGNWIYKILNTETVPYSDIWVQRLAGLTEVSAVEIIATDRAYGHYLGELVKAFVDRHQLQVDFVSSHGHTVFHQPQLHITFQVGSGAYLAAAAEAPTVCDFRTLDIALGGQGAPLVPIGDRLLFAEYDFCLNLGGISNISQEGQDRRLAFDISCCNMLLNPLAGQLGMPYDKNGDQARSGSFNQALFDRLNEPSYFSAPSPKSIGKEWADENSLRAIQESKAAVQDKLHTACHHMGYQIAQAVRQHADQQRGKLLLTGGGAFNSFLVEQIRHYLGPTFEVVVPEPELVNFKEALIFAFLGVLRWRQEPNCLQSVTGARHDNCGGAIYWN
ncbi:MULTISPECIES: anhydro-N-acetylmuramic acid kinase [Rufibacter]|uniref:Anhydro-N-acetylmuramic acid kinase n=1 Tax=Rufibacter quisquiliarum TaxID=1549639 RepID=A0A839GSM5_9BACT|nr:MULTISPECIES: anhydro-N-acetylmuramic acid kinase [Rufibacter]MBA9078495.1 anhydro-N-acetylmuramic acid kinase [Rufibacter quisquiliarum]